MDRPSVVVQPAVVGGKRKTMAELKWDERYAAPGYAYGLEPNTFLVEQAGALGPGPVLSLGEGEGRNAVWLAERGLDVTAVDVSGVGLAKAQRLAEQRGVKLETIVCDLATFDLGASSWGAIISVWCHLPPPLRTRVHGSVARALRTGGTFLLEAYTPAQLQYGTGGPKDPEMLVTLAHLQPELVGLELVVGREIIREVHEGAYHEGTSAVVQVVARKV